MMNTMKLYRFSAEELAEKEIADATDDGVKCGGCNWRVSYLYVLANSKEEALKMIENGEAGLCGNCMSDLIVDEDYQILIQEHNKTKPKTTTEILLDKIKSFEWCWHINSSIGGHDCWRKLFQEISKLLKTKEIIERIGYTIFLGEDVDLVRIASFCEFDNEGTGFELFYKDSHTDAKWYMKKKS